MKLRVGMLPDLSICITDLLPSWIGFRHPCRNDGYSYFPRLVYNDESRSLGISLTSFGRSFLTKSLVTDDVTQSVGRSPDEAPWGRNPGKRGHKKNGLRRRGDRPVAPTSSGLPYFNRVIINGIHDQ